MILKLNVWEVGINKGYRIYMGKETQSRLEIKPGYKTYFYHNEHGMFMRVVYPNTPSQTPKDPIEIEWGSRVSDIEINKVHLGRFLMEKSGLDVEDTGTFIFELKETNKADTLRVIFMFKTEPYERVTEDNLKEKVSKRKKAEKTIQKISERVKTKEVKFRETKQGYLKPDLDKEPKLRKPEPKDITQEMVDKYNSGRAETIPMPTEEKPHETPELKKAEFDVKVPDWEVKTNTTLSLEAFRRTVEWAAADLNTLAGRMGNMEITKDEEKSLREDVINNLKKNLERLS